jgi:hypothetical protein
MNVKPVVVYGSETWVITEMDGKKRVHERGKPQMWQIVSF